ncbi:metalloregulator ArsR/SmtB family transcription factor [Terribacillus sp. 179-K 1B1 HS]|uniref:ArsR/SmtB family transcription factor n=1 Tax=Terribacillus sp. 179-K 1B1 HS TaxID=3142388 RepID=UPI0039A15142
MFQLNSWIKQHVKAVYSPYHELLLSLHVLVKPDHHLDRLNWANELIAAMPKNLYEAILFYGQITNQWLHVMDSLLAETRNCQYAEEAVEGWNLMNDHQFVQVLLGPRTHLPEDELTAGERQIRARPAYHKKCVYELFHTYYHVYFARELYNVEPWLIKAANDFNLHIKEDAINTLKAVHPRFLVEEDAVHFLKARTYTVRYQEMEKITIFPSTFVAPHLLIDADTPHVTVAKQVSFPAQESREEVPLDLLKMIKALADPTRLKMTQLMLYHPYCTQQLTEKLGLAKATVSKHLKLLETAGLLDSTRSSHYVFYKTNKHALEMIRVDMDQFFDSPKLKEE